MNKTIILLILCLKINAYVKLDISSIEHTYKFNDIENTYKIIFSLHDKLKMMDLKVSEYITRIEATNELTSRITIRPNDEVIEYENNSYILEKSLYFIRLKKYMEAKTTLLYLINLYSLKEYNQLTTKDINILSSAMYWTGEILTFQEEALDESLKYYNDIINNYPGCDKYGVALYKRALIYLKLNNNDAITDLEFIAQNYPSEPISILATNKLDNIKNNSSKIDTYD